MRERISTTTTTTTTTPPPLARTQTRVPSTVWWPCCSHQAPYKTNLQELVVFVVPCIAETFVDENFREFRSIAVFRAMCFPQIFVQSCSHLLPLLLSLLLSLLLPLLLSLLLSLLLPLLQLPLPQKLPRPPVPLAMPHKTHDHGIMTGNMQYVYACNLCTCTVYSCM